MVNTIEDRVKSKLYNKVLKENPGLDKSDPQKYQELCRQEFDRKGTLLVLRYEAMVSDSSTLQDFFRNWVRMMGHGYEYLTRENQRKRDKIVLYHIIDYFCDTNLKKAPQKFPLIRALYKEYYQKIRSRRKPKLSLGTI